MLFFDIYIGMFIMSLSSYVIESIIYIDIDIIMNPPRNVGISRVEERFMQYKTKSVEFIIFFLFSLYCFLRNR